jgi:acyl carrier protein
MTQNSDRVSGKDRISAMWAEVLGAGADPDLGFLENGGDSFRALTLSDKIFQETGIEIDFLDVLESKGVDSMHSLLKSAADAR